MIPDSVFSFLAMGAVLGLTAGLSPGPMLALVVSETLRHSKTEGIKVALSPLITDLPIILLTVFIFSKISHSELILALISVCGGIFLAWLGFESLKTKEFGTGMQDNNPRALRKGITANFLNPHPYLFWLTVGTPLAYKASELSLIAVILYFISFYSLLIGSKIIVALLVEKSKVFLKNKIFTWTIRLLGLALLVFSIFFLYDGIKAIFQ